MTDHAQHWPTRVRPSAPFLWRSFLIILLLLPGLYLRLWGFETESWDYKSFLSSWYADGIQAVHNPSFNYMPLYLYLLLGVKALGFSALVGIKFLSVIIDLFLLAGVVYLARRLQVRQMWLAMSVVWYAPTIVLNGAWWGQCDALYAAFLVWGIACLLHKKWLWMALCFALAFCAKLQSVFVLAALLPLWAMGVFGWRQIALMAATTLIAMIVIIMPVVIGAEADFWRQALLYMAQPGWHGSALNYNAPTFNSVLLGDYVNRLPQTHPQWRPLIAYGGIAISALGIMGMAIWSWLRKPEPVPLLVVQTFCLAAIWVPYFLPEMHERYFYMAEVLLPLLALHCARLWLPAIALLAAVTAAYISYLYGYLTPTPMLGLVVGLVLWRVLRVWLRETMQH